MTGKRVALIIATDTYEDKDLRKLISPAQDVEALAQVLKDPNIGGFDIRTPLINKPSYEVNTEIEEFFTERKREDVLLLYFSGHGIKDEDGLLYFCTTNTRRKVLRSTAIEANFVNNVMHRSRSQMQVLLLDCCYSGAFARGMLPRAGTTIDTKERFTGKGLFVLTASDAMQYAFEGDHVEGQAEPSVFTSSLVQGLKTGAADTDGDGEITPDELYEYVYNSVIDKKPEQRPRKWNFGVEGKIILARNPNPVVKPVELPKELLEVMNNPNPVARVGAVHELRDLLYSKNKGLSLSAWNTLKIMQNDDSRRVSVAATKILDEYENTQSETKSAPRMEKPGQVQIEPTSPPPPQVTITKLRSTPEEGLSKSSVKSMLQRHNFYCGEYDWSKEYCNPRGTGIQNNFEKQTVNGDEVVFDHATGLTWQPSGSKKYMSYEKTKEYIQKINTDKFAGYDDWRLPTLEEAMSLMKPTKNTDALYIDPLFDKQQNWIWTSDTYSASRAWVVFFSYGNGRLDFSSNLTSVRAVR